MPTPSSGTIAWRISKTGRVRIDFFFERLNATVLFKPFKLSALDSAISSVFS